MIVMNYQKLGFKCGLEIHQQLETRKLFCNCPSIVHDENPDIKVTRKLRAVAGETGAIDKAAEYEKQKNKIYIYEACSSSSCLVELDEEPPHKINKEALEVTLEIAMLLNAKIVDNVQVMRKTVVDGSNVSGFQRTALIAVDGYIDTSKGKVTIALICLEEEAAKKIKEDDKSVTYRLDRLGVPLVEIATDPDIKDAEHAKEVASILGMILRSTNKVKRGIGTIRQDINVTIKGHPRVELKGFQDLKSIPKTIEKEVKRQAENLKKKKKLKEEVRKVEPDFTSTYLRPMPGSARMYPESDLETIAITKDLMKDIKIPELIAEKVLKLEKEYNLRSDIAKEILDKKDFFEALVKEFKPLKPDFIAHVIIDVPKEIKSRLGLDSSKIKNDNYKEVLAYLSRGEIEKGAVIEILAEFAAGKYPSFAKYKPTSSDNLKKDIIKIVEKNKGAPINALMGEVMKQYRGKVDGRKVMEILKEVVS